MMKKIFLFFALTIIIGVSNINAQCIINPFTPNSDSIYGAIKPNVFRFCESDSVKNMVVQFLPMTKYISQGDTLNIDSFQVIGLIGQTTWLNYETFDPNKIFRAGEWTCINFSSDTIPNVLPYSEDSIKYEISLNILAYITDSIDTQTFTPNNIINLVVYRKLGSLCEASIEDISDHFFVTQNIPNPFTDKTSIGFRSSKSDIFELKVYNTVGQIVYSEKLNSVLGYNYFLFNGSELNKGIYIYTVNNYAYKLVKN